MDVILKQYVVDLVQESEVVRVAPGCALDFLLSIRESSSRLPAAQVSARTHATISVLCGGRQGVYG